MADADWFLTSPERDNPASDIDRRHLNGDGWTRGNLVEPLVEGATYFARLHQTVSALGRGDLLMFTDWRGDVDELLDGPGTQVGDVIAAAAERGVDVRGLLWRSHRDELGFFRRENLRFRRRVEAAGGQLVLDQRVRRGGSHHQKLVVARGGADGEGDGEEDVAFVGGVDLAHSRHDDGRHLGDPNARRMPAIYGTRPPWHDLQLQVRGPAVGDLDLVFRERWQDPTPPRRSALARLQDGRRAAGGRMDPLPPQRPDPLPQGPHAVQVLRTYPARRPPYPFAPEGERSIARAYLKALQRARRLVYLEDQYLWSAQVARAAADALRSAPELQLVIVVPRRPERDGPLSRPPYLAGRRYALRAARQVAPERVHVFDVENEQGVPVYLHAKVRIVDDVWASVGSDNLNRRSWSHDSEVACAVLDDTLDDREPADPAGLGDRARRYARDLRLTLAREHLGRAPDGSQDIGLLDPDEFVRTVQDSADRLEAWHRGGRRGPRPPGRLRPHHHPRISRLTGLWAIPVYHLLYDPDGRPRPLRRRDAW